MPTLRLSLSSVMLVIVGCDQRPRPSAASAPADQGRMVAQVEPIAQLPPGRVVHVAVDPLNNVLYSYETENGLDGVLIAGSASIPRATQLTSANILAAMGEKIGGNGAIQDLATGTDGAIYFYFIGGKGRLIRACVGRFVPKDGSIRILFDTAPLARLSGMGQSIDLARGSLIPSSRTMELFLRHTDAWCVLTFLAQAPPPGTEPKLTKAFDKVQAVGVPDALEQALDLTRSRYDLSAGPGDDLLLLDRTNGELWQVTPGGSAKVRNSLSGLPSELSQPLVVKEDHLLIFAAASDPIVTDVSDIFSARLPKVSYPALVEISGKEITAIGRDDLHVPAGFPGYAMRIGKLVVCPDGGMVGYDQSSGELMRIRWVRERGS